MTFFTNTSGSDTYNGTWIGDLSKEKTTLATSIVAVVTTFLLSKE